MSGMDGVMRNLMKISKQAERNLEQSITEGSHVILDRSNELVPVATGELKDSGKVEKPSRLESEVTYDADYAIHVHEDLEAFHPHGQAKFLQTAISEKSKEIIHKINEELLK